MTLVKKPSVYLDNFFQDRTVLVTGATGFIGSHLVDILVEMQADVRVLVRESSNLQWLDPVLDQIVLYKGDLLDLSSLLDICEDLQKMGSKQPIIFHLAAQSHVGESWVIPHLSLETNIMGTLNILEAIRRTHLDIHMLSIAASSEEYGNQPEIKNSNKALDESSPIDPVSPYGVGKAAADFLARSYALAYQIPIVVVRKFNNFGPRQRLSFITPDVIRRARLDKKLEMGDLRPQRDFLFVRDGAYAHIFAATKGTPGQIYCAGYGETITMRDWTEKILALGKKMELWDEVPITGDPNRLRPGDSELWWLLVDSTKLRSETGWQPLYTWDEGLEITLQWYAEHTDLLKVQWDSQSIRHNIRPLRNIA